MTQAKKVILYCRVSTLEQGISKNGLESQQAEMMSFCKLHGFEIVDCVNEVVSGKHGLEYRPVLKEVIAKATKIGATVLVNRLDRLSRSALFILTLMQSKLKFTVTSLGNDVDEFTLHLYSILGERERKLIGERTKSALAAKKAREPEWLAGNRTNLSQAGKVGAKATAEMADMFAQKMKPVITRMVGAKMSLQAIARELNEQDTKTPRGGKWTAQSVSNLKARWAS